MSAPTQLQTVSAAAAGRMLGLSKNKTLELVRDGRLPAKQLDGRYRVRLVDIDAFIASLPDAAVMTAASSENHLHQAAEDVAAASEKGTTQRKIAEAVGKSATWELVTLTADEEQAIRAHHRELRRQSKARACAVRP